MGLAFGTFCIGRNSVARASALLCCIFWTRVHAARTDLPLLQVDRPRPDRFDKSPWTRQQSCLRHRPSPWRHAAARSAPHCRQRHRAPRSAGTRLSGVSSSPLPHRVHAVADTSQPDHGTTDSASKETDQRREMSINSGAFENPTRPPATICNGLHRYAPDCNVSWSLPS